MTMKRFNLPYKPDHRIYGGELTLYDFEGHNTMLSMAEKIQKSINFDKQCKRNIELRNNMEKQEERK